MLLWSLSCVVKAITVLNLTMFMYYLEVKVVLDLGQVTVRDTE